MSGKDIYKLTPKKRAELQRLANMSDKEIDLTDADAPEVSESSNVVRGKFYRPIKQQVTLRLDSDVVDWFKRHVDKYQTLINKVCREYMEKHKTK